jgi:hypothetical protein
MADSTVKIDIQVNLEGKSNGAFNEVKKELSAMAEEGKKVSQSVSASAGGFSQNLGASISASIPGFGQLFNKITAVSTSIMALNTGVAMLGGTFNAVMGPIQDGIGRWSAATMQAKQLGMAWESSGRSIPLDEMKAFNAE